jgi:hypothetical protein
VAQQLPTPHFEKYQRSQNLFYSTGAHTYILFWQKYSELDTPLWAFKVSMDWAGDATQSGYKFIPFLRGL